MTLWPRWRHPLGKMLPLCPPAQRTLKQKYHPHFVCNKHWNHQGPPEGLHPLNLPNESKIYGLYIWRLMQMHSFLTACERDHTRVHTPTHSLSYTHTYTYRRLTSAHKSPVQFTWATKCSPDKSTTVYVQRPSDRLLNPQSLWGNMYCYGICTSNRAGQGQSDSCRLFLLAIYYRESESRPVWH